MGHHRNHVTFGLTFSVSAVGMLTSSNRRGIEIAEALAKARRASNKTSAATRSTRSTLLRPGRASSDFSAVTPLSRVVRTRPTRAVAPPNPDKPVNAARTRRYLVCARSVWKRDWIGRDVAVADRAGQSPDLEAD